MNAPLSATATLPSADTTAAFLRTASLEITPKQIEKLALLKEKLPAGCSVFIALIDAADLAQQIEATRQLKAAGFRPVPHVPARFVRDEADLRARIKALADDVLAAGGTGVEVVFSRTLVPTKCSREPVGVRGGHAPSIGTPFPILQGANRTFRRCQPIVETHQQKYSSTHLVQTRIWAVL